jgi:hypothetical protein
MEDPIFKRLQEAGVTIYLIPPRVRLHDKLIIVDGRYVVEGSTNWSISALRENFESATLIDSPELARQKMVRLKIISLASEPEVEEPNQPRYIENLPEHVSIPKILLLDKRYFPAMLTRQDSRCLDLYLLMLTHSQAIKQQEFFIDMEDMGLSLSLPEAWSDSDLRRQVIRSLEKLKNSYALIQVRLFHSQDAWVKLIAIPGETFVVSSKILKPDGETPSMRLKFLLLVKALLESEGEDINSISHRELARRFHVHHTTINDAFQEFRK